MADNKLDSMFVELKLKSQQLEASLNKILKRSKVVRGQMEQDFARMKVNFSTAVGTLKLDKLRKLQIKLKAEFAKKVKLNVDSASLDRTRFKLAEVDRALEGTGQEAKSFGNIFAKGMAIAVGAAFALRKAWNFSIQAKDAARDADESKSKFNQVFSSIRKDATLAADEIARKFKLADSTAKELLGTTGDLLVGFGFTEKQALSMSKQVNELAVDLASFSNIQGGTTRASMALTKGLLGERESMKLLGISVNEDTKRFKELVKQKQLEEGASLVQAKALATLQIAYEQSDKAIGDFSRTQHQLANRERIRDEVLKERLETIGNTMIPFFTTLTNLQIALLEPTKSLSDQFFEQDRRVKELSSSVPKLLDKYDSLILSTDKSEEKQAELKTVLEEIATLMPGAITLWDEHGKALNASRKEAERLLKAEQGISELLNRPAIAEREKEIKDLERQIKQATTILNRGTITETIPVGIGVVSVVTRPLGQEEITALRNELQGFQNDIIVLNNLIKKLKGEPLIDPEDIEDPKEKVIVLSGVVFDLNERLKKLKEQEPFEKTLLGAVSIRKEIIALERDLEVLQLRIQDLATGEITLPFEPKGEKGTAPLDIIPEIPELEETGTSFTNELQLGLEDNELAVNSLSTAFSSLLHTIENGGDLIAGFWSGIKGTVINALSDIMAKQITTQLTLSATSSATQAAEVVKAKASGALVAAAWSSAATFASIATFGGAALTGSAAVTAAVAANKVLIAAHDGGTFEGGRKVASFAGGGDFVVPGGFGNDSFPMMVESGERVQVTPSARAGDESKILSQVLGAIQAMNMNLVNLENNITVINNSDTKSTVLRNKSEENILTKAGFNFDEL